MAEISWIKLSTSMFDDEKIRLIRSMPEGKTTILIWVQLLTLAGKTNDDGMIYIARDLPYSVEMLATLVFEEINVVRMALETLMRFQMIEVSKNNMITISNWEKYQNIDGMERVKQLNAKRNRKYRERKKQKTLGDVSDDVSVTSRDATEVDIEVDIDIDKDKEIDSRPSVNNYLNDTEEPPQTAKTDGRRIMSITEFVEKSVANNGFRFSLIQKQQLAEYVTKDGMEAMVIFEVLKSASDNNIRSFSYVDKTLKDKLESGILTLEQFKQAEQEFQAKKTKTKGRGYNKPKRVEKRPDWENQQVEVPTADELARADEILAKLNEQQEKENGNE